MEGSVEDPSLSLRWKGKGVRGGEYFSWPRWGGGSLRGIVEGIVEDSSFPREGKGVSGGEDIPWSRRTGGGSLRGTVEGMVEDSSESEGLPPGSGPGIFTNTLYFVLILA